MAGGGTLMLLGENNPYDKPGITALVNSVTSAGGYCCDNAHTGAASEVGTINSTASATAENFDTDYMSITTTCGVGGGILTQYPGGAAVGTLAGGKAVVTHPAGTYATGVAFLGSDLKAAYSRSKLFIWYDWQALGQISTLTNCCPTGYNNMNMVKNIMDFLVVATPTPNIPITKSISATTATIGDTLTYCLSFTNLSGREVTFNLWDSVPAVTDFIDCDNSCGHTGGSPDIMYWDSITIADGESKYYCFWVRLSRYP